MIGPANSIKVFLLGERGEKSYGMIDSDFLSLGGMIF